MSVAQKSPKLFVFLSLFSSLGTLTCCALPALLVSLGLGSTLASMISAVPQLTWLSEYKMWNFAFAGGMLAISGVSIYRARSLPCPIDPNLRRICLRGRKVSNLIFGVALACYATGAFYSFIAPRIL